MTQSALVATDSLPASDPPELAHETLHGLFRRLSYGHLPFEQSRLFAEILRRGDEHQTRFGRVMAGYDEVKRLAHDPDIRALDRKWVEVASPWLMANEAVQMTLRIMLTLDGEPHRQLRAQFADPFSPRSLHARAAVIEAEADRLAHHLRRTIEEQGGADLMSDFAKPLPLRVVAGILGLPRSCLPELFSISAQMTAVFELVLTRAGITRAEQGIRDLRRLLERVVRDGELLPGIVTDLLDQGCHDTEELVGNVAFLVTAGFETTAGLIGNSVYAGTTVLGNPDIGHLAGHVTELVTETLRWDSPVRLGPRRRLAPDGATPSRRDVVVLWLAGANRDPRVFDRPHEFLLDRPQRPSPLSFGAGIHVCLGRQLALMEAQVALRALITHLPRLRPTGPAERVPGLSFGGFTRLGVTA